MTTKIFAILAALCMMLPARCAEAASLGMSVPVFIAHMGMAFDRVKWGFSPERIKESVVRTPDGNYAAEYSPEIFLYLYVEPGDENLNYIALTFSVDTEASLKSADGESQYESLCRQLVFALEEGATNDTGLGAADEARAFRPRPRRSAARRAQREVHLHDEILRIQYNAAYSTGALTRAATHRKSIQRGQ